MPYEAGEIPSAVKNLPKGAQAGIQVFINELDKHSVQLVETDGQTIIRGLPVLRPGTWNGVEYTEDMLRKMAGNFQRIQENDAWQPPLRNQHSMDHDGEPLMLPADATKGWFQGLYYDPEKKVLCGDVLATDGDMVSGVRSGKLKHISSELNFDYQLSNPESGEPGEKIGPALVGAAWVDNPAVKGMPWELCINAADYRTGATAPHPLAPSPCADATSRVPTGRGGKDSGGRGLVTAPTKATANDTRSDSAQTTQRMNSAKIGGMNMGAWDKLKALLQREGATEEELAELGPPAAEGSAHATSRVPTEPAGDPVAALTAQVATLTADLQTARGEAKANGDQVAILAAREKASRVGARLEGFAREGKLAPAERENFMALAMNLGETPSIAVLAADGKTTTTVSPLDQLFSSLAVRTPLVSTQAQALGYVGPEHVAPEEVTPEDAAKRIQAIVDRDPNMRQKAAAG